MPRTRAIAELKLYGERNTGTRFLIQLLKRNFAVPLLSSGTGRRSLEGHRLPADADKHGWLIKRMLDERFSSLANRAAVTDGFGWKHMSPPLDVIGAQMRRARATLFVVIVKHPVFWALSFKNRPYHSYFQYDDMDFSSFLRHLFVPSDRDNVSAVAFDSVIHLYATKVDGYRALADLGVPFELVRYEELILDVPGFIKRLEEKYGLERASDEDIIRHESTKLKGAKTLEDYREKYRLENVRSAVSAVDHDFIMSSFGPERLGWLGYS